VISRDAIFTFLLIWGVWLLIPVVTDGLSSLWQMFWSLTGSRRRPQLSDIPMPRVSVIVPAYNEQANIDRCIISLKAQTYPHELLEIIIVDDGSQDNTVDRVLRHISRWGGSQEYLRTTSFTVQAGDFGGDLHLLRRKRGYVSENGKAAAVNAALDLISGEIVVAVDSDIVLEPDAIENAVWHFMTDETLVAATGHLIIDPYLVVALDSDGNPMIDAQGMPINQPMTLSQRILNACQFLEYAMTFHLGRYTESRTNTMFTLAGACSVFRRSIFQQSGKYRGRTVSEDADLTLTIHELSGKRIGYLPETRAHLAPVLSWSSLYSQRVRWQRGALEVIAVHEDAHRKEKSNNLFWKLALPLRLQVDHTLAMPRLVWTFMIFVLPLFGYSWNVIGLALVLFLVFYTAVNLLRVLVAYLFSSPPEKVFVRKYLGYLPVFTFYNMFLFWTRMSGILRAMSESATWNVGNPLLDSIESGAFLKPLRQYLANWLSLFN
jgi:poly-beta-1,6-N-acetyl-D-glucosamine synthase